MPITYFRSSVTLVTLMALTSCSPQERPVPPPPVVATPSQHWMQGKRLEAVMGQLAGLHDVFPKGMPDDATSPEGMKAQREMTELAAVADALADTAQNIPAAVENKPMSADDRRGFIAQAMRLHDQAILLRDAARAKKITPLEGMRNDINFTCISCHSHYRDISGELNSYKASAPAYDRDITAFASNKPSAILPGSQND